jgi:hypothetical protein
VIHYQGDRKAAPEVLTLPASWSTIASPGNVCYHQYLKLSGVSIHARPGSYALVTTDV